MVNNLRSEVSSALRSEGYRRHGRSHSIAIDDNYSFEVDLGPIGTRADTSPWVGLRCIEVETIFLSMLELPPTTYTATVGANIGYLLSGRPQTWLAEADPSDVLGAIHQIRDFLTPYANLKGLRRLLGDEFKGTHGVLYFYRLIVINWLLGDSEEVERWLKRAHELECNGLPELCEQYLRFERNFSKIRS